MIERSICPSKRACNHKFPIYNHELVINRSFTRSKAKSHILIRSQFPSWCRFFLCKLLIKYDTHLEFLIFIDHLLNQINQKCWGKYAKTNIQRVLGLSQEVTEYSNREITWKEKHMWQIDIDLSRLNSILSLLLCSLL